MSDGQWLSISLHLKSLAPAVASRWLCILQVLLLRYYSITLYRPIYTVCTLYMSHLPYITPLISCCICYTLPMLLIQYHNKLIILILHLYYNYSILYLCIPEDVLYIYGGYSKEKESGQKKEGRIHEDMWAINLRTMLTTIGKCDIAVLVFMPSFSGITYDARQCRM